jgi:hypothetical protein
MCLLDVDSKYMQIYRHEVFSHTRESLGRRNSVTVRVGVREYEYKHYHLYYYVLPGTNILKVIFSRRYC